MKNNLLSKIKNKIKKKAMFYIAYTNYKKKYEEFQWKSVDDVLLTSELDISFKK